MENKTSQNDDNQQHDGRPVLSIHDETDSKVGIKVKTVEYPTTTTTTTTTAITSSPRRTFEEESSYLENISPFKIRVNIGLVPNMRIHADVFVNEKLQKLLIEELRLASMSSSSSSSFLPSLKQMANVASLPGVVKCMAMPDVHSGYGFCIGNGKILSLFASFNQSKKNIVVLLFTFPYIYIHIKTLAFHLFFYISSIYIYSTIFIIIIIIILIIIINTKVAIPNSCFNLLTLFIKSAMI